MDKYHGVGGSYIVDENGEKTQIIAPPSDLQKVSLTIEAVHSEPAENPIAEPNEPHQEASPDPDIVAEKTPEPE